MKKKYLTAGLVIALGGLAGLTTQSFATNITISDQDYTNQTWHTNVEDDEVEPNMAHGQQWDLEAFLQDGFMISVIGGYDFENGEEGNNLTFKHGDIFIDINNDAKFGGTDEDIFDNPGLAQTTYGYEYVLDVDFLNMTYSVYGLDENTTLLNTVFYSQNDSSNPWRYHEGGTLLTGYENLSFQYVTGLTDTETGFSGGAHNMMSGFDLSFLGFGVEYTIHTTMECGNDNLMGQGVNPVPEPATMLLFGAGLAGLAGISRRRKK